MQNKAVVLSVVALSLWAACACAGERASVSARGSIGVSTVVLQPISGGGPICEGGLTWSAGLSVSVPVKKRRLEFEGGVAFFQSSASFSNWGHGASNPRGHIQMLSMPLLFRRYVPGRLSVDYGVVVDIDVSPNESVRGRSGVGPWLGLHIDLATTKDGAVFLSPYIAARGLLAVETNNRAGLLDIGIGIGYRFSS